MFKESFHPKEGEEKPEEEIEWYEGNKSHLKKGVRPIMACVETIEQLEKNPGLEFEMFLEELPKLRNTKEVDYYSDPWELKRQNFKNAGNSSYVISTIDDSNKFSKGFKNCTGLVVSGIDKETGENISFLSHEDPGFFLRRGGDGEQFMSDLGERLEELKARSAEGTIDAVIVGGNYFKGSEYMLDYLGSIHVLSDKVSKILGFEPMVIAGPKEVRKGTDNVFFDNKNRRLYVVRPEVGNERTEGYMPKDMEEQEKKWSKKDN